jgi:hypothetical protein
LFHLLSDHHVTTVAEAGWAGMKNGELLERATENFDVFVTIDANLPYQQALERFRIGVVLLRAPSNRLADLESLSQIFSPSWIVLNRASSGGSARTGASCDWHLLRPVST